MCHEFSNVASEKPLRLSFKAIAIFKIDQVWVTKPFLDSISYALNRVQGIKNSMRRVILKNIH